MWKKAHNLLLKKFNNDLNFLVKKIYMTCKNLINRILFLIALFWFSFSVSITLAQSTLKPLYSYLNEFSLSDSAKVNLKGPARVISFEGRKGLNTTSIHSALQLKAHNLKSNQGTVSLWVMRNMVWLISLKFK